MRIACLLEKSLRSLSCEGGVAFWSEQADASVDGDILMFVMSENDDET